MEYPADLDRNMHLWGDEGKGNVIDLSSGFPGRQYHETQYGSTGGTLDD
jgi:adenylosuccinate synthase